MSRKVSVCITSAAYVDFVLIWHELRNRDGERDLHSTCKPTKNIATNECVDIGSRGTEYAAYQGEDVAHEEEPPSTEYIRESADDEEA